MSTLPHPARAIGVYRARGPPAPASRHAASRSGGSPTRATSAPSFAPRMRSAPASPSPTAAPTRCRRRRSARRRARSSACRSSAGTTRPAGRVALVAHGGEPLDGGRSHAAADVPPRRRARGAAGRPRTGLSQGHDPAARRGGVAERGGRRGDRALRACAPRAPAGLAEPAASAPPPPPPPPEKPPPPPPEPEEGGARAEPKPDARSPIDMAEAPLPRSPWPEIQ